MNTSENPPRSRRLSMSSEALMGTGVTIAGLGLLGILLGGAQYMRSLPTVAAMWLALGAIIFVIGVIMALAASKFRRR